MIDNEDNEKGLACIRGTMLRVEVRSIRPLGSVHSKAGIMDPWVAANTQTTTTTITALPIEDTKKAGVQEKDRNGCDCDCDYEFLQ